MNKEASKHYHFEESGHTGFEPVKWEAALTGQVWSKGTREPTNTHLRPTGASFLFDLITAT